MNEFFKWYTSPIDIYSTRYISPRKCHQSSNLSIFVIMSQLSKLVVWRVMVHIIQATVYSYGVVYVENKLKDTGRFIFFFGFYSTESEKIIGWLIRGAYFSMWFLAVSCTKYIVYRILGKRTVDNRAVMMQGSYILHTKHYTSMFITLLL